VALHDFPLTRARFLVASRRKADSDNPFKDVDEAVIDDWCERASDEVQSALGDRATPPLLQWDAVLEGAAIAIAHYEIILFIRGINKGQGADAAIVTRRDNASKYLDRLRNKQENPRFVDSGSNFPRDAVQVISQRNSTAALLNIGGRRCC
jgi:phage gp36-like protein